MQKIVEHAHVGIYIYQLLHRHSTESGAQFCVNEPVVEKGLRPDRPQKKKQRPSQYQSTSIQQVLVVSHTPHT